MYRRNTVFALCVIVMLPVAFLSAMVPQPTTAKFVISAIPWVHEDEYGQGIKEINLLFANGTTYDDCGWWWPYEEFRDLDYNDWFFNTTMVIELAVYVNSTHVGFTGWQNGLNYVRHSITVSVLGDVVFSQQNFTYSYGLDEAIAPMYYYAYNVTLSCFNLAGQVYELIIDYEIFGAPEAAP